MEPKQALQILSLSAEKAPLPKEQHIVCEKAHMVLSKLIADNEKASEKPVQVDEVGESSPAQDNSEGGADEVAEVSAEEVVESSEPVN